MQAELTLESLGKELHDIKVLVAAKADNEETPDEKKARVAEEEKDMKEHEAKVAMEDKKEDEKMEAKRATRDAAIKRAMEEPDTEKKDAAIKKAMEDYDHEKKEAFGKPDDKHEAMDDEHKKEHEAQIASIINDKKNSLINQILTANRIINPTDVKSIEARLKTASITDIEKEWKIVKPFVAGTESTPSTVPPEKFIPFYANITPADVDASQLNASSPDSEFSKLSTKELLEMGQ